MKNHFEAKIYLTIVIALIFIAIVAVNEIINMLIK